MNAKQLRAGFDGLTIGEDSDTGYYTVGDISKAVRARVREFCKGTGFKLKRVAKWQLSMAGALLASDHAHIYIWLVGTDHGRTHETCTRISLYLYARKVTP